MLPKEDCQLKYLYLYQHALYIYLYLWKYNIHVESGMAQINPFLIAISSILKLTNILCSLFSVNASKVSKLSDVNPGSALTFLYQRDNVAG